MSLAAIAMRDLRGAPKALRIFLACVLLGVASIAAVGLVVEAAEKGIEGRAGTLLGGDLMVRTLYTPITPEARAYIDAQAERTSQHVAFRTMTSGQRADGGLPAGDFPPRQLIELKAVDAAYPLRGELVTNPPLPRAALFGERDGRHGVAVEQDLLGTLGLKVGDNLAIGTRSFAIRAVIVTEPDRLNASYALGPRVLISDDGLAPTGLLQPGSLFYYRLTMTLPDGRDPAAFEQDILERFDDGGWQVSNLSNAAPGLRRAIDRLGLFLAFAAVATLLIGGVGIANATTAYFHSRLLTIARFKSVGMTQGQVTRVYLLQLLVMTLLATAAGLSLGIALEYALLAAFGDRLPVEAASGVYPRPLGMAALYGLITALAFGLPPLLLAGRSRPALLLRDSLAQTLPGRPSLIDRLLLLAGLAALLGLTVAFTGQPRLSLYFALALAGSLCFFLGLSALVSAIARRASRPGGSLKPTTRLAYASLHRPGAITGSVIVSMGLGSSLLVAIALVSLNFHAQLTFDRAPDMPAFFLIDIPATDAAPMAADLARLPGVGAIQSQPMLRGRIAAINGKEVDPSTVAADYQWVLKNERGISYADSMPEGSQLTAGTWWPKDYAGEPLVSFVDDLAEAIHVKLGDTMTFAFMGREVTARVANLREVNWSSMQMNFSIVLTPGAFGELPVNYLATVKADDAAHGAILRLMAERYPGVSVIRLKETLRQVAGVFDSISTVVLSVAAESLLVGLLVIAGALSASLQSRAYETVLLKVIGQTRREVKAMLWREMLLLVGATILLSLLTGSAMAWLIGFQMHLPRMLFPWQVYAVAIAFVPPLALLLVSLAGRRLLGLRPLSLLRGE